jgi:hypothetical protein
MHASVTHIIGLFRGRARLRSLVALACAICMPSAVRAQDAPIDSAGKRAPYSSLDVSVKGARVVSAGSLGADWRARDGVRMDVHAPFHVGELGVSVSTMRFDARAGAQPDFRAYLIGLDWRFAVPAPGWIRPRLSITAGDFLTIFDDVEVKGMAKESEVFVGGSIDVAFPVAGATSLTVGITGVRVLTSTPVRLGVASAGVAHSFTTPLWLRRVIE